MTLCCQEPDEDWRTSPHLAEDWTKRHTHWSQERNRYITQPFKDSIQRCRATLWPMLHCMSPVCRFLDLISAA